MTDRFGLHGARVQSVRPGRHHELLLETYAAGQGLRRWELSADGVQTRWLETFGEQASRPQAAVTPFALLARARLEGGRILACDATASAEVRLQVETAEGEHTLLLSLDRRRPELVLLDAGQRVAGAAGPRVRQVAGEAYAAPEEPSPLAGPPERLPPGPPDAARTLDAAWQARLAALDLAHTRAAAARALTPVLRKLERRRSKLEDDRRAAADAQRYERWGELLKIHGARAFAAAPGATEVRVPDEFDPERPEVAIPADPALPLAGNIAALFRQYRKRHGARVHVARRLAETEQAVAQVRAVEQAVATAATAVDVEQAVARWRKAAPHGLALRPGPAEATPSATGRARPAKGARRAEPLRLIERTSSDGLTILIGRSAVDNDALTFRLANGRDWWLHASGWAGSHVVVRNPAGGPLPAKTLREAAWLAAHYSKARNQDQAEVIYGERKHVRRVPKGPPGQVTLAHGRTLWVNLRDAALRQVLDVDSGEDGA